MQSFAPFLLLHDLQRKRKLSNSLPPPLAIGLIWSIEILVFLPQIQHSFLSPRASMALNSSFLFAL